MPLRKVQVTAGGLQIHMAQQELNRSLKPDYALAFVNRGIARRDKGDVEGALQDYNEAIRLKPDRQSGTRYPIISAFIGLYL
jgi:tetratricopeptide (TPR) repeat protein